MKKRVLSILMMLCLALTLLPVSVWAADSVANVRSKEELNDALNNASVTEIRISADMTYNDPLNATKPVQVDDGVTLTLNNYQTTVSGTIINNGTIQVNSSKKCSWTATTTGKGKLIGGKDSWGDPSTYVDYGCVPETMLDGCRINIVKDISQAVTAALPDTMQTGDTINVTFSNLIDGVNPADVFKFTWKNSSDFPLYDNAATPTLTETGALKLSLSMKTPYVMCTSNGTMGSLDARGTVTQKLLDTVYVDQNNGNNSNLGDTAAQPVKSIAKALDKITDGGQIVLLSDYRGLIAFSKSVTVKCEDGNAFTLTSSSPNYVSDGVTVTLKNLNFSDSNFCRDTQGTGSLIFTNCTGSLSIGSGDISNITMENSQLSGNISASESLSMKSSTFSGQFNTKNFAAEGDCTISCKKNAPSLISGTVTAGTPVKLVPFENAKAGDKLLEVPNSIAATSFALSDTSGVYGVVFSAQYNGNYLCLAQRITSENGKIAVGYEPQIKHVPNNPADVRLAGFDFEISTFDAAWSGNASTSWSADEIPKLTVTLKANDFYFFDNSFDVNKLQVYSWTDMTTYPTFDNGAKNDKVTCRVEDGQGISGDGKTFTFTVEYPKIERLKQNLIMDTADRTASCKEVLQPRHVSNPQGTLSYESSDPEIASVDSATGVITVNKPGTVTITIHAAQTDIYAAAETSYQLVISHKYSDTYKADDETHWKECACGEKTDVNNHADGNKDHKCDVCGKILSKCADTNKDHKCDLCGKTLSEHTGGTATCKDKAKCAVCGESYGELDANNHTDLKHIEAKAATKTSEGNIEYWYCEGCGKYYKDAKATQEITKEQTVTAKLPSDNNTSAGGSTGNNNKPSSNATTSPQTGDNSNMFLWIALLFVSGGVIILTTVISRKKKYNK
ncbi:LPXTG cell wall anchor domain-containing protein [Dorea sp. OM07-5]|uniref:LPXTG cell wall anchor domain-containing protein n=1 Tax=Dorea sp. OM07-5 TaxID=2293100 RepID=UPI000E4A4603|nr:LPXTG cell wall anchor domain-containing protein [Dorea sp. OM07-5]RHU97586.1 LPXTG cell wall anchor domain-containing protein [Dorea sp. OM07-5]